MKITINAKSALIAIVAIVAAVYVAKFADGLGTSVANAHGHRAAQIELATAQ